MDKRNHWCHKEQCPDVSSPDVVECLYDKIITSPFQIHTPRPPYFDVRPMCDTICPGFSKCTEKLLPDSTRGNNISYLGKGKSFSNMPWEKHVSSVLLFPYHFVHIPCTWHVRTTLLPDWDTEVAILLDHTDRTRASIKDRQMFKVVPCWISISWLTLKQTRLSRLLFFWVLSRSLLGVWEDQCFPNIQQGFLMFSLESQLVHMSNQGLWRRCNLPRDQFRCFRGWWLGQGCPPANKILYSSTWNSEPPILLFWD